MERSHSGLVRRFAKPLDGASCLASSNLALSAKFYIYYAGGDKIVMRKSKKIKAIIQQVTERIQKEYQPEKIILFGSYAYGKPTEESDIDIFIIKESNKRRIDRFCEVMKILRDIKDIPIQPVVFTKNELNKRLKIRDDFINEILEKGEVLYAEQ